MPANLCYAILSQNSIMLRDNKTGISDEKLRARRAEFLDRKEKLPADLDALIICTCTGYLCPGVTSYVSEQLGLRTDAYLQDLVGLGCGAAHAGAANSVPISHVRRAVFTAAPGEGTRSGRASRTRAGADRRGG